jgi:hypothetical protein
LDPTRKLKTKIMISQTSRLWNKQARVAYRIKQAWYRRMKPADSGLSKPEWPTGLSKPVQEDLDPADDADEASDCRRSRTPDQAMEDNPYLRPGPVTRSQKRRRAAAVNVWELARHN